MLPNPHWDPRLRPLSGRDRDVAEYLNAQPDVVNYVAQDSGFLDHWLPRLKTDTRSYVTVAFGRSEEHTSELKSLMRISYAVLCMKKQKYNTNTENTKTNSIHKIQRTMT